MIRRYLGHQEFSFCTHFLARGLCDQADGERGPSYERCMSQTRKAVAALFAVTVSTAVGIGYIHHEQTEERKVRPSDGREPFRAELPASTCSIPSATLRATDLATGRSPNNPR